MQKNSELGWALHEHLVKVGLETPMVMDKLAKSEQSKISKVEKLVTQMMETLGLDLTNDSLEETPRRVSKMFVNELFSGLNYDHFPKCTAVDNTFHQHVNEGEIRPFVLVKSIKVNSLCEHHLLPIVGVAHIAYIPGETVLGLSKLARIVDFFARRPQVQERLCEQIAEALTFASGCKDVAVYIDASHSCMRLRGVSDPCSETVTLATRGAFATTESRIRSEFLGLVASFN